MSDHDFNSLKSEDDDFAKLPAEGEAGAAGHDPYAPGETEKQRSQGNHLRTGDAVDAVKSAADAAALGGGPQIAGVIGALANAAVNPGPGTRDLDAYRSVRDDTAKDLAFAEDSLAGKGGSVVGAMLTPGLPSAAKGATAPERVAQAAHVGGLVGGANAAFRSPVDLTKPTPEGIKQFVGDVGGGYATGLGGGAVAGGALSSVANPARSLAEEQALRAAGLRGGITDFLRKKLGIQNMEEGRQLGRQFLDEGLIPIVGSAEAVGKRADKLQGQAGNVIGGTLSRADMSAQAKPDFPANAFSFSRMADDARAPILDPAQTTAVSRASAGKALDLADLFQKQGEDTPGSFVGANRAKSDAWKGANFDADPDLAAVNYRKAVSGGRKSIENQVAEELSPLDAFELSKANERWGVGADALKLAENAQRRDAAKQGVTMGDLLALIAGTAGGSASGHEVFGPGLAAAAVLGKKAFDKYGHSSLARAADAMASRSGGGIGGQLGSDAYLKYLTPKVGIPEPDDQEEHVPWKSLQGGK